MVRRAWLPFERAEKQVKHRRRTGSQDLMLYERRFDEAFEKADMRRGSERQSDAVAQFHNPFGFPDSDTLALEMMFFDSGRVEYGPVAT